MMTVDRGHALLERLPSVQGRMRANVSLAKFSWFRVGGPAEVLYIPADLNDLSAFLAEKPDDVPVTVIGVCSNLLIRDGGIDGVVIRLGRGFADITIDDADVRAGAGALDIVVARRARDAGVAGLEFLSGVPGTIGGAVRMNAGAYGSDIAAVLRQVTVVDAIGAVHELPATNLVFDYRRSNLPDDWIVCRATLEGRRDDIAAIATRMDRIDQSRRDSQPIRARTGGSTFTNPAVDSTGKPVSEKAWQLIDRAGCRGLRHGGAMVSEQHCNFLVNTGNATAADLESLGETVRRRVLTETGVSLEWEIRRIGRPGPLVR